MSRKKKYSAETPVIELGVVAENIIIGDESENTTVPNYKATITARVVFVKRNSITFEFDNHFFEKNIAEASRKYKKDDTIDILCEGSLGKPDFKILLV